MDRQRPRRAGFTLIEVLVAILIVAFLIALLVPAVLAAFRKAKEAQVAAEMNNLSTALAGFREKFGDYPPSRLYISESGYYPATNALAQRSLGFIKRFWPRVALNSTGAVAPGNVPGGFYDFNNNGIDDSGTARDQFYILQGPECLVFFLGGLPTITTNSSGAPQFGMSGFDRNPLNPFRTFVQTGAQATSPNRTVPLYDFASNRLDDSEPDSTYTGTSNSAGGNGVPSYLDPLGSQASVSNFGDSDKRPYAYFYSYGSNSYDPDDYNTLSEVDDNGTHGTFARTFTTSFSPGRTTSQTPNPYTSSLPDPGNLPNTTNPITATYLNSNAFQLISSGQDREWGIGGEYDKAAPTSPLPLTDAGTANVSTGTTTNPRQRENDNITNFSGGRLN